MDYFFLLMYPSGFDQRSRTFVSYREEGLYHRGQSSSAGGRLVCSLWRVLSCVSLEGECEGWKGRPCLALTTCILHDDLEGWPEGQAGAITPELRSPGPGAGGAAGAAAAPCSQVGPAGWRQCVWFGAEQDSCASPVPSKPSKCPHAPLVAMLTQDPRGKGILGSVATWVQHKTAMIACTADSLSFRFSAPPQTGGRRFSVAPSFGSACEGCPTGRQRSGGLHSRVSFPHGSGGWKSNVRVSAGLVS